jgi:protein-S-isoprenylcysteine O-methyltransferase Ste14
MKRFSLPQLVWMAAVAAMVLLHFLLPLYELIPEPYTYCGWALLLGGFMLTSRSRRIVTAGSTLSYMSTPGSLIISGPFRYSRNPIYLGAMIINAGLAIILGSLGPWAVWLLQWLIFDMKVIPPEERMMEQTFGADYIAYRKKVRRWI